MIRQPYIFIGLTATFFTGSNAIAETSRETINKCFSALAGGNSQSIALASDSVKKLRFLTGVPERVDASICLTKATGENWRYFSDIDIMAPSSMGGILKSIGEAKVKGRAAYETLNQEIISESVYSACVGLHGRDEVAAMTNQSCVALFQERGHPDLPSKPEFMLQYISPVLAELTDEELSLINSLSLN